MESQFFEFLNEKNTEKLFKFLLVECGSGMDENFISFNEMNMESFFRKYAGLQNGKFAGIGKAKETYLFSGPDRYMKTFPVITKSNPFAVECAKEWNTEGKQKWITRMYNEKPNGILFDMDRWYDSFSDSDVLFTWFGKLEIRKSNLDDMMRKVICETFGYFLPCILYACYMKVFSDFPELSDYVLDKRTEKETAGQLTEFFAKKNFNGFFCAIETTPEMDVIFGENPKIQKLSSSYDKTSDEETDQMQKQTTSVDASHVTIWKIGSVGDVICVRNKEDEEKMKQIPEFKKQIRKVMMVSLLRKEKPETKICLLHVASKRKTANDVSIFMNDVMLLFSDYIFVGDFNTMSDEARQVIVEFSRKMNALIESKDPTTHKKRAFFQTQLTVAGVTDCSQKDFIFGKNIKELEVYDLSGEKIGQNFLPNIPSSTNNPDHFMVMVNELASMNIAVDNSSKLEYFEEKTENLNKEFVKYCLSMHDTIGSLIGL